MPEAAALARIEARQLAFVERLTRYADRRAARAEAAIRELGLNPAHHARLGPHRAGRSVRAGSRPGATARSIRASSGSALSLARMDALERGLNGIPQVMPADMRMISSGFGYRSDPFHGGAAMHAGLDFRGPHRLADPCRGARARLLSWAPSPVTEKSSRSATATA